MTVFNSPECFNTARNFHVLALLHTCAYFFIDFAYTAFVVREHSELDKQMYVHHLLSMFSLYLTFVFMNWLVVFSVMMMFTEISSTYVCLRWLFYTHNLQDSIYNLANAVAIFLSFLFGRLIFQLFVTLGLGIPALYRQLMTVDMQWWELLILTEGVAAMVLSIGMNIYWMTLIVQQIVRLFKRNSAQSRQNKQQEEYQPLLDAET